MKKTALSLALLCLAAPALAHDPSSATYIANEGVLVTAGETKIMFDPLFDEGFGTYLTVPVETRAKMMAGQAPFDGIDAVFISHAHGDHFAAKDVAEYLETQTGVTLFAPQQAVDRLMLAANPNGDLAGRVFAFKLEEGDADVNMKHYRPHKAHWKLRETDMAFPPYWMLTYRGGPEILDYMNIRESVGTHVPIKVPGELKRNRIDYFSVPGETRVIGGDHEHE